MVGIQDWFRLNAVRDAAFALFAALALALGCDASGGSQDAAPDATPDGARVVAVSMEDCAGSEGCAFSPSDFVFETGETVRFKLTSENEFHTFTVPDLGVDEMVNARATRHLDVAFDRPGEYALICVPHEALGMVGTIAVR